MARALALLLALAVCAPPTARASSSHVWRDGEERAFVSAAIDLGFLYVRPRLSAGFGRPHFAWAGVEMNPIVNIEGVGAWTGLRVAWPNVDIRAGARWFTTFRRSFLVRKDSYTRVDLELRDAPRAEWVDLETELSWRLPLGAAELSGEHALTWIAGVPTGLDLYEENLRLVVTAPWVWRSRIGALFFLDAERRIRLGPVLEVTGNPGRGTVILRGGVAFRMRLYDDLELRSSAIPALAARDELGARAADVFLIGIRYRWASE